MKKWNVVDVRSGRIEFVIEEAESLEEAKEIYEGIIRNGFDRYEQYKADFILESPYSQVRFEEC